MAGETQRLGPSEKSHKENHLAFLSLGAGGSFYTTEFSLGELLLQRHGRSRYQLGW